MLAGTTSYTQPRYPLEHRDLAAAPHQVVLQVLKLHVAQRGRVAIVVGLQMWSREWKIGWGTESHACESVGVWVYEM